MSGRRRCPSVLRLAWLALLLTHSATGCILLLNGWLPIGVQERAKRADLVLVATARRTFKEVRSEPGDTYSAEFEVRSALKGTELLRALMEHAQLNGLPDRIFNVSNFGDKTMCYADVHDADTYILFLKVYDNRLVAKYDDIFGAAADYTPENENLVLKALGWNPWSDWTVCSASCEGGLQERQRKCDRLDGCEGPDREHRPCNSLRCEGVRDLLSLMKLSMQKPGVQALPDRPGAYRLSRGFRLEMATRGLYPTQQMLPADFSILATLRPPSEPAPVLGMASVQGEVKLALSVGQRAVEFIYADAQGLPGKKNPAKFDVVLGKDHWHHLAVSLEGNTLTLYADCKLKGTIPFTRSSVPNVYSSGITAIGAIPKSRNHKTRFEGDLEQLIFIPDPKAARQQCGELISPNPLLSEYRINSDFEASFEFTEGSGASSLNEGSGDFELEWSEWGHCSVTCGRGIRTRTSHCVDNGSNLEECIESRMERVETRLCQMPDCHRFNFGKSLTTSKPINFNSSSSKETKIKTRSEFINCLNGGKTYNKRKCICRTGYRGERCQFALCEPACQNGGHCIRPGICTCVAGYVPPSCTPMCTPRCFNGGTCMAPNKCRCPMGYTGINCEQAVCKKGCRNGGRCVAPDKCVCISGYTGDDCSTPICHPPCRNGGTCLKPYYCLCAPGSSGSFCEKFTCTPKCKNGGKCVGLNNCSCAAGFTGKKCENAICTGGCRNGGTCLSPNKCACPKGFYGNRCDKRKCKYVQANEPYQRGFKKLVNKTYQEPCGAWGWKMCLKTKSEYETVFKTFYRTTYKCAKD